MDTSRIRQKLAQLRRERDGLEQQLISFRSGLVVGCLSERYTECRKGNCKCTQGKPHGPFLYMSVYKGKGARYRYVGKKEDQKIVEGLRRYKRFQSLLEKLRKVGKEINLLWNCYREELTCLPAFGGPAGRQKDE